ncbi:MAG TPA: hypothetical protein PLL57_08455 [Flavobacteriales bacterium]|nr:hypothetical protein [Flavobacteriales bacterium]
MARILLPTLFLVLLHAITLNAQFTWDVKAGGTHTYARDPLGAGHVSHTGRSVDGMGYHAGVGVGCKEERLFGVRAEVVMDVRSCGYQLRPADQPFMLEENGEGFMQARRNMHLVSAELPVLLTVRRFPGLRLDGGMTLQRTLAARETVTGQLVGLDPEQKARRSVDRTAAIAPWDIALTAGVEVDGGKQLHMGLRYLHGLADLDRPGGASPTYLRTWQLYLSYVLHGSAPRIGT